MKQITIFCGIVFISFQLIAEKNNLLGPHRISPLILTKPDISYRQKDPEKYTKDLNKKENLLNRQDCVYFMIESKLNGELFHSAVATNPKSPVKIVDAWGKNFNPKPTDNLNKMYFWSYYLQWDAERPAIEPFEVNPEKATIECAKDDVNTFRKIYECCGYEFNNEEVLKNLKDIDTGESQKNAYKCSVSANCAGNIIYGFQGAIFGQEWENPNIPEKTDGKKESFWEVRALERFLNEKTEKTKGQAKSCHIIHDEMTGKIKKTTLPFGYDSQEYFKTENNFLPISIRNPPPKENNNYDSTFLCHLMCESSTGKILHLCSVNRFLGNFYNPTDIPVSTKAGKYLNYKVETYPPDKIASAQKFYPDYPQQIDQIPEPCRKEYATALAQQKSTPLDIAFEERFALFQEAYSDEEQVYYPGLSTELMNYFRK